MSSWELRAFQFLDVNPHVKKWASEEIVIPYFNPLKAKVCKYYPDLYMEYVDKDGNYQKYLVEIKPEKEKTLTKKSTLYDKAMIVQNQAKWEAAEQFCEQHGLEFMVLTEKGMFKHKGSGKKKKEESEK
jgi:hypothetical protein